MAGPVRRPPRRRRRSRARSATTRWRTLLRAAASGNGRRSETPNGTGDYVDALRQRAALVPLVRDVPQAKQRARRRRLRRPDGARRPARAGCPRSAAVERQRYRAVLLDEYQDTGARPDRHAARAVRRRPPGAPPSATRSSRSTAGAAPAPATWARSTPRFPAADGAPAAGLPARDQLPQRPRDPRRSPTRSPAELRTSRGHGAAAPARRQPVRARVAVAFAETVDDEADWVARAPARRVGRAAAGRPHGRGAGAAPQPDAAPRRRAAERRPAGRDRRPGRAARDPGGRRRRGHPAGARRPPARRRAGAAAHRRPVADRAARPRRAQAPRAAYLVRPAGPARPVALGAATAGRARAAEPGRGAGRPRAGRGLLARRLPPDAAARPASCARLRAPAHRAAGRAGGRRRARDRRRDRGGRPPAPHPGRPGAPRPLPRRGRRRSRPRPATPACGRSSPTSRRPRTRRTGSRPARSRSPPSGCRSSPCTRAKGLEWDVVAVPGPCRRRCSRARAPASTGPAPGTSCPARCAATATACRRSTSPASATRAEVGDRLAQHHAGGARTGTSRRSAGWPTSR